MTFRSTDEAVVASVVGVMGVVDAEEAVEEETRKEVRPRRHMHKRVLYNHFDDSKHPSKLIIDSFLSKTLAADMLYTSM